MTMELVLAVTALSSKRRLSGPSTDCSHPPLTIDDSALEPKGVPAPFYFIHLRSERSPEAASSVPRKPLQAHVSGSGIRATAPQTGHPPPPRDELGRKP